MVAGVLGKTQRHPPTDGGEIHVHQRPEIPSHPPPELGGLESTDQVPSAPRHRNIRVSDQHYAPHEPLHPP